ncbi:MAG TPA: hypothetical protein DDX19_06770 [Rhodopirellula baltica]|uniref:Uncharacterized protein n=1 Tax=Rhodopirellula baltica (strain DSM 10527 / NCIMB 13988 / SH1) TaxID=243090 RepID=Q7UW13_RHOBA|nr:hypothetical protein [Rhodopirellula baltica]CAD72558.1 hypothetical protein RB2330 [Rhodopirellula baltica SH 1]HBE62436.1 hypothetical protein [Rhodopirellula baltica]
MTWQLMALIVGTLTLVPYTVNASEPTPKIAAQPEFNQVHVKIIMPTEPADHHKNRPVVESWIAEDMKILGQAKFTAVTGWVRLDLSPLGATDVWGGTLGDRHHCPVGADIPERSEDRMKVHLSGWSPGGACVTVSLKNEPGSRVVAAVKQYENTYKTFKGMPYVAVLIGPPVEKPSAETIRKN